jgi:hypothetical protein
VQVYFPDVGWVRFDPTPAGPREDAEQTRIEQARSGSGTGVGSAPTTPQGGSEGDVVTITPQAPASGATNGTDATNGTNGTNGTDAAVDGVATPTGPSDDGGDGGPSLPELPSTRTLAVWAVAVVGLAAVGRRTGAVTRLREAVALRRQRRGDPAADAVRAYDRLETLLERRGRPRRAGETPRAYVEAAVGEGVDPAARSVVDAYERAQYGDGVDRETADEAVATVDRLVGDETAFGG